MKNNFWRKNLPPLLLIATIAIIGLFSTQVSKEQEDKIHFAFMVQSHAEQIVYLDEVLTMSARMAVFTGDDSWVQRYNKNTRLFDLQILALKNISPKSEKIIANLSEANSQLIIWEEAAIKMAGEGYLTQAQALLFSDSYKSEKINLSKRIQDLSHWTKQFAGDQIQTAAFNPEWEEKGFLDEFSLWEAAIATLLFCLLFWWASKGLALLTKYSSRGKKIHLGRISFRGISLGFIVILLSSTIILAWTALSYNKKNDLKELSSAMQTILNTASEGLEIWLETKKMFLAEFAFNPELRVLVEELQELPQTTSDLLKSKTLQQVRLHVAKHKDSFGDTGFFIISKDNISLASMRDENTGTTNLIGQHRPDLLQLAFQGQTVFVPPIPSDVSINGKQGILSMFLLAPIVNKKGDVIAIISQRVQPEVDFTRITSLGRIGQTGETYAFDTNAHMLTESRFIGPHPEETPTDDALSQIKLIDPLQDLKKTEQQPLTFMAQQAIQHISGENMQGYRGYRGVTVVGVWKWNKTLGIGITTEMNLEEALRGHYLMRLTLFSLLGLMLILSIIAIFVILLIGEKKQSQFLYETALLEDKVRERTSELKSSMLEAQQASKVKSEFLANMSHEIRTPMNAVLGMCQLCLQTELTDRQKNYLYKLDNSAHMLLRVINDVLDISKIEADRLELEKAPLDLANSLELINDAASVLAKQKGLKLYIYTEPGLPAEMIGDSLRIEQVLINLVNNAIKFTETGSVTLHVREVDRSNGIINLEFKVEDTGIGMAPEVMEKIFQPFTQADTTTTRKFGGTGLGLSISKQLVKSMGGQLTVESEEGVGSKFIVRLPLTLQEYNKKHKHVLLPEELHGLKILAIDDNAKQLEYIQLLIKHYDLDLSTATSGVEALAKLQVGYDEGNPYDLVLMDWQLPEENGLEINQHIKEHQEWDPSPKVILMTAIDYAEVEKVYDVENLDGLLIKPVGQRSLINMIKDVFSHANPEEEELNRKNQKSQIYGSRVLVVDDVEINREIMVEILNGLSIYVETASNGVQALQKMHSTMFDLVLMDIQMPEMDGLTATGVYRQEEKEEGTDKHLPIIAMTAHAFAEDRQRSLEAGMDDHLIKPVDPDLLKECLIRWITSCNIKSHVPLEEPMTNEQPAPVAAVNQQPAAQKPLPVAEGVNLASALARYNGKEDRLRKFLKMFYDQYQNAISALRELSSEAQKEEAERQAHSLKGVSASVGADALSKLMEQVEQGMNAGGALNEQPLDQAEEELQKFLKVIEEYL